METSSGHVTVDGISVPCTFTVFDSGRWKIRQTGGTNYNDFRIVQTTGEGLSKEKAIADFQASFRSSMRGPVHKPRPMRASEPAQGAPSLPTVPVHKSSSIWQRLGFSRGRGR